MKVTVGTFGMTVTVGTVGTFGTLVTLFTMGTLVTFDTMVTFVVGTTVMSSTFVEFVGCKFVSCSFADRTSRRSQVSTLRISVARQSLSHRRDITHIRIADAGYAVRRFRRFRLFAVRLPERVYPIAGILRLYASQFAGYHASQRSPAPRWGPLQGKVSRHIPNAKPSRLQQRVSSCYYVHGHRARQ